MKRMNLKRIKFNHVSSLIIVLLIITCAHVIKTYFLIRHYDIGQEIRIKHVSVVQSFIYKNSNVYKGRDAVITVFNDEQLKFKKKRIYCKRKFSSGNSQIVHGHIMNLIEAPWQCLLSTYRMVCPFHSVNENDETVKFEIGSNFIIGQKIKFHEFSLTKPDSQPRGFVSCMSRMIAFENWALFLVQMETFRYYGGDLVVAYIECAVKKVFELMKVYEKDGLLKIRHAYKGFDNPYIPYDSDAQTEYANQMTNSHLCLYEFRESAEFISFTDWDDVLLLERNFGQIPPTFVDTFRKISVLNPSAAAYSISRYPFINEKAFRPKSYQFSLEKLFNQLHYSLKIVPPKLIVHPQRVTGVWIHSLGYAESEKYKEIHVNSTLAAFLHIKNLIFDEGETETTLNKLVYTENGSRLIVGKVLQQNMINMFTDHNFTFNPSAYSHSQIFHKLIFKCYDSIAKMKVNKSLMFCPTHKGCIYPEQNITVIKVTATYKKPKKIAGSVWHERDKVDFVESKKGCL